MLDVLNCVTQQHDISLVALSAAICALGCFVTVTLMALTTTLQSRSRAGVLCTAAILFGLSVWALHFVAMLAFLPGAHIAYNLALTAISIAVAVAGSLAALIIWRYRSDRSMSIVSAGLILGITIGGMHYIGVEAMRTSAIIQIDQLYAGISFLVSVVFSILALARAENLSRLVRRTEVALWLALAICGLHFTGMTALTVAPITPPEGDGYVLGSGGLALVVGLVTLVILLAGLGILLLKQYLALRTVRELARMRLLGELAHEVLLIHRAGTVLEINSAGARLFGMPVEVIIGRNIADLFAAHNVPSLVRGMADCSENLQPQEYEARSAVGDLIPVEMSSRAIEFAGKPAIAMVLRSLADRKRDEERIRYFALHDALTELPNRYLLGQRLTQAIDAAVQGANGLAVIYIDLDRFKPVNDLHGHAVGDALLIRASKRMLAELRSTDTLARVGGDEFIVILNDMPGPDQVSEIASRLVATVSKPFQIEGQQIEISASVGVALYPSDGGTAEALLRASDTALYRVKDEGRGSVRFFEPAMDAQLQARRKLEYELGLAVERNELHLFFQPIVNGVTGEIETFEALIRWFHPQHNLITPAEFIPLAEQSDLIVRIGAWVIDVACATAASWPESWRVAINVSPSQLRRSDVPKAIAAALSKHKLDPARLVVEITESVLIQDVEAAVAVLTCLREMGVRVALDDFGTGYSSLSYLQRFKFDKIKIDRSFIQNLGDYDDTLTIVRAIINLGHNLGMMVTVEGVETVEQLNIIRTLNCNQMQGYLFGKPSPSSEICNKQNQHIKRMFDSSLVRFVR